MKVDGSNVLGAIYFNKLDGIEAFYLRFPPSVPC